MNNPISKRPVRASILLGFSLALLAVVTMGYFAYTNVRDLAISVEEALTPDDRLGVLDEIITDLNDAESSVKTFAITQDQVYLRKYVSASGSVDGKMAKLVTLAREDSLEVDTISQLVQDKYAILKEMIEVMDDGGVKTLLDRLREKAEVDTVMIDSSSSEFVYEVLLPDSVVEEKKGLLGKLFGKKNPGKDSKEEKKAKKAKKRNSKNEELAVTDTTKEDQISPEELIEELEMFDLQDQVKMAERRERMFSLTLEGERITTEIRTRFNVWKNYQARASEALTEEAENSANETRRFMAIFCLVVLVVCLILLGIIFNDISRNRKLQIRLEREKARAEKLAKAKEEFLANMSHEIRTPMNAVIGFADQLATTPLTPKQSDFLGPIRHSASYLLALLNDILDYSKLESGNFQLEVTGFWLSSVLQDVLSTFGRTAESKGIELKLEEAEDVPEVLLGDPLRLKQMLFNLVSNAIKFTRDGSVVIAVEVQEEIEETKVLKFSVIDSGIGIPEEQLEGIFSDFIQADSSTTRKYGGTGLGLSITKKLTELHKGQINIQSELNHGTTVSLILPFREGSPEGIKEISTLEGANWQILKGRKAIVADDEPYNRMLIQAIMDKWGVTIHSAENGLQLVNLLEKNSDVDFILMDLQMPEMDGFQAATYIRKELKLDIPILALTATSTQKEIEHSLSAGMNGHLLKPFKERELFAHILRILGIAQRNTSKNISLVKSSPNPAKLYDFEQLLQLANNDKAFMLNMLNIFVSSTESNLKQMRDALAKSDWNTVSMMAHKIIPPSRHLGLMKLVDKLKKIELDAEDGKNLKQLPQEIQEADQQIQLVIAGIKKDIESFVV